MCYGHGWCPFPRCFAPPAAIPSLQKPHYMPSRGSSGVLIHVDSSRMVPLREDNPGCPAVPSAITPSQMPGAQRTSTASLSSCLASPSAPGDTAVLLEPFHAIFCFICGLCPHQNANSTRSGNFVCFFFTALSLVLRTVTDIRPQ